MRCQAPRKPVLDHGHMLSVHRVVTRDGARRPQPGERRDGVSIWWRRNGEMSGRIGHLVEIHAEDAGTLTLDFTLNGQPVRQSFALVGRPCRFGGHRWLACCPRTGRLAAKLYGCSGTFPPRHAAGGSYRSQDRVSATEKLRDREVAILMRLDADDSTPGTPPRPKWMRWATYGRLIRELRTVRTAYGIGMAAELYQLTGLDLSDGEVPEVTSGARRQSPFDR